MPHSSAQAPVIRAGADRGRARRYGGVVVGGIGAVATQVRIVVAETGTLQPSQKLVLEGGSGMIGSKRKVKLIFDDLRAKGISDEMLSRVNAPIGLAIGSQTVAEIAVSIVAELIARRSGSMKAP